MGEFQEIADEYFRSLNVTARRISDDVKSTRENYESAWNYLSRDEQNQVINESLIYPDAVLKYSLSADQYQQPDKPESFPVLKTSYGQKIIQDESTGVHWRDEHSSPFAWKTYSQLSINIPNNCINTPMKKKPPAPPPKPTKQLTETPTSSQNGSIEPQKFPDYPSTPEPRKIQEIPAFPSLSTEGSVDSLNVQVS